MSPETMPMRRLLALLVLVAVPLTLAAAPKATPRPGPKTAVKAAPRAAPNWTSQVTASPIGGYVMGNPAAATRVVEYISYTCPHCAHFTQEADAVLKKGWVQGGKASVEIRNAVRDSFDLTAALLARCGGPTKFFGNHVALFANYDGWMARFRDYDAIAPTMEGKSEVEVFTAIADKTALFAVMEKRGFRRPQLVACLSDKAEKAKVLAMTDEAWNKVQIGGTPGFSVNGKLIDDAHDWDGLKAALPPGAS